MYIPRLLEASIQESLTYFPVVAITGPRQCGKSTLAKHLLDQCDNSLYLDLEKPADVARLTSPELFFSSQRGKLICIDEVQRMPDLFPLLRSLVDEWGRPGAFLILGSASRDMLRQSSETLAGRIAYHRLMPFLWDEVADVVDLPFYLVNGAFPSSTLAPRLGLSLRWRENFIATFLERDLLGWKGVSPVSIRRLWTMLAHENGTTVNYSKLAGSLGVSDNTVRNYIDLLVSTYMLEAVPAHHSNLKKRLVKAPRIYLSDTGILTSLLGLKTYEDLLGHPAYGALWEQVTLTTLRGLHPDAQITHYRSASGAEMDFVLTIGSHIFAVECKASMCPTLSRGTYVAIEDIRPEHTFVVAPVDAGWPLASHIDVIPLERCATIGSY